MSSSTTQFERLALFPNMAAVERVLPLDSLRGLLALGVFAGHAAFNRNFWQDRLWHGGSGAFAALGSLAVTLFFMIAACQRPGLES